MGAILIAAIVVAIGYAAMKGIKSVGVLKLVGVAAGTAVALTVLRLLWKLVVFAWQ